MVVVSSKATILRVRNWPSKPLWVKIPTSIIFIDVIRLTTILKEALAERNNSYAWMDTDGKFYPVLGRETHADWANRYLNRDKYGNITQQHDSIMQMWKKGWMRIANDGDTLYAHNETTLPNRKQLKELIDLAIEYNFSKVVGDAGEDYKILWTEHDQLNEMGCGTA
jgi:hypothetical protein